MQPLNPSSGAHQNDAPTDNAAVPSELEAVETAAGEPPASPLRLAAVPQRLVWSAQRPTKRPRSANAAWKELPWLNRWLLLGSGACWCFVAWMAF